MGTPMTVTLFVEVTDRRALYDEACRLAREDGLDEAQLIEMLGRPRSVDVSGCLRYVFDPATSPPGVSILDSSAE